MSWDFFVPVCVGDLVKTGGINQYVVQDVVPPKQLPPYLSSKLSTRFFKLYWKMFLSDFFHLSVSVSEFKAALRSQGPLCILEHFDTGYSVLQWVLILMNLAVLSISTIGWVQNYCLFLFKALQLSGAECERGYSGIARARLDLFDIFIIIKLRKDYVDMLGWSCIVWILFLSVVSGLAASLPALLISTSVSAAERKEKLNTVKMSVYLLCKITETLESESYRQSIVTAPGKVWWLVAHLKILVLMTGSKLFCILNAHWWDNGKFYDPVRPRDYDL